MHDSFESKTMDTDTALAITFIVLSTFMCLVTFYINFWSLLGDYFQSWWSTPANYQSLPTPSEVSGSDDSEVPRCPV